VGARQYLTSFSERSLIWQYFQGKHIPPVLVWHRIGANIVSVLPTGPAEFVLITQPPQHLQGLIAGRDPAVLLDHVDRISPEVGALARGGQPIGRMHRMVRYPCYFRQPHGPGWVLVGDAGHAKDATLGHGINDALRNTRLLAAVLIRTWADPPERAGALAHWASQRNRVELANYWYGQDIGRARPVNAMERAIVRGVQRNARATRRLDDVMGDRLSANRLMTPRRVLAAAGRRVLVGESPRLVARQVGELMRLDRQRRRAVVRQDPRAPSPPGAMDAAPTTVLPAGLAAQPAVMETQ
jgi:2-polyprenyl-6-methoxyphenol hydroxylase-like FAD-dependent oxidoreductase